MFKFIVAGILLIVGSAVAIGKVPTLKQRAIEIVNPAAKEGRLLGELKTSLDQLETSLDSTDKNKIENSKNLLKESKELLTQISNINSDTGIVGAQIGKIINALTDQTPYPADHLQTKLPSPTVSCPPVK